MAHSENLSLEFGSLVRNEGRKVEKSFWEVSICQPTVIDVKHERGLNRANSLNENIYKMLCIQTDGHTCPNDCNVCFTAYQDARYCVFQHYYPRSLGESAEMGESIALREIYDCRRLGIS